MECYFFLVESGTERWRVRQEGREEKQTGIRRETGKVHSKAIDRKRRVRILADVLCVKETGIICSSVCYKLAKEKEGRRTKQGQTNTKGKQVRKQTDAVDRKRRQVNRKTGVSTNRQNHDLSENGKS